MSRGLEIAHGQSDLILLEVALFGIGYNVQSSIANKWAVSLHRTCVQWCPRFSLGFGLSTCDILGHWQCKNSWPSTACQRPLPTSVAKWCACLGGSNAVVATHQWIRLQHVGNVLLRALIAQLVDLPAARQRSKRHDIICLVAV
jgi:hypothetical protein